MCTLRGIWILKENLHSTDIIFSKRMITVETRVRMISGTNYNPIPNDNDLLKLFCLEILYPQHNNSKNNVNIKQQQQQQQQSSTDISSSTSLIHSYNSTPNTHIVSLNQDKLWPFIYIKRKNYYYLTLPVIEEYLRTGYRPPLIDLLSITASLNFLEEISQYAPSFLSKPPPYPELQVYLANVIPFGQPIDANFNNVKTMIKSGFPMTDTFTSKRPAWKPYLHKGKQQLDFTISENVQCILYDNPSVPDVCKTSGSVYCKADLEGMPEVSLYFNAPQQTPAPISSTSSISNETPYITHLAIDSSVQATSDITIHHKISFNPPLDQFKLLSYGVAGVKVIPIRGFYQMKEISNNNVKILVQLKLNSDMTNSFEYCVLKIPFKNRGNILHVNASPTTGSVHIDISLRAIIWNIGQKFTGRNLEVALPAEITFQPTPQHHHPQHPPHVTPPTLVTTGASGNQTVTAFPTQSFPITETGTSEEEEKDLFCSGSNSYLRVYFKLLNCTLSGLNIDTKKIVIYPAASKAKFIVDRDIISSDYIIWNSLGSAKFAYTPTTSNNNTVNNTTSSSSSTSIQQQN
eukprot:gene2759-3433_t